MKLVMGTVTKRSALEFPSLHPVNSQLLVGVAVRNTLVPIGYAPAPVTLPPAGGFATTVSATLGATPNQPLRMVLFSISAT